MESSLTTTEEAVAKRAKAIPEEIPIEAAPAVIQELAAQAEETFEERRARLAREEYLRRAAESHKEREKIYRDNGLLKEGESLPVDQATLNARCCGRS